MKHFGLFFLTFLLSASLANAATDDSAVHYLELQGAIDSSETFNSDQKTNLAEVSKIIFELFHIKGGDGPSYWHDVPDDAWFKDYANLSHEYALWSNPNREFMPSRPVLRAEALEMLLKAYGVGAILGNPGDRVQLYSDVDESHPHYSIIKSAADHGILVLNTRSAYRPYKHLTRGEFAEMIYAFDTIQTVNLAEEQGFSEEDFYKSEIFTELWNDLSEKYYLEEGQEIDEEALFQAAVKGLVQSLDDPYTSYYNQEETTQFYENLNGELEGIGIVLTEEDGKFLIGDVLTNAPAEKAGLRSGDKIIAIDELSTEGLKMEQVSGAIRGESGTSVTLIIERYGSQLIFEIIRAHIQAQLESAEVLQQNIWLLDINGFAGSTPTQSRLALEALSLSSPNPKGIVIDLRSNMGGYVHAATGVANLFMEEGSPILVMDYGDWEIEFNATYTGPYAEEKLFILVNEYTASASEILALSLQEQRNATIVGTQTFGKGVAQELIQYWDGSALRVTVAQWLSGNHTSINGVGVTPDIQITGEDPELWLKAVYEAL
jgi:carboxyl-terminal processing protease